MTATPEAKPDITADQFAATDMRVGQVTAVAPFPQARKPAYQVTVDFGPLGTRHTSAQITNYDADTLVGRLVVGAVNLGRKRIAGFVSEFLLLGAVDDHGTVRLLHPDDGALPGDPVA